MGYTTITCFFFKQWYDSTNFFVNNFMLFPAITVLCIISRFKRLLSLNYITLNYQLPITVWGSYLALITQAACPFKHFLESTAAFFLGICKSDSSIQYQSFWWSLTTWIHTYTICFDESESLESSLELIHELLFIASNVTYW